MKTHLKALGAALALAFSVNASATLLIDGFTTDQGQISSGTVGSTAVSQLHDSSVLGGFRELLVTKTGAIDLATALDTDSKTRLGVSGGKLKYSNDSDVAGTGIVRWDGAASGGAIDATGLGGIDLAGSGNAFVINVVGGDVGAAFTFVLEAYTSATQYSSFTLNGVGFGLYSITFADLVGASATKVGGGVDMTNLGALQLAIAPGAATPFSIDITIDTVDVPEPASLALVGLGLLGLGAMRRRQA